MIVVAPEQINEFANYLVLLAFVPYFLFSLTYGYKDKPWKTYLGFIIWGLITTQALVLGFVASRRWWGAYFGYEWIAVILYGSMILFAWSFYVIYLVERRRESAALAFPLVNPVKRKAKR